MPASAFVISFAFFKFSRTCSVASVCFFALFMSATSSAPIQAPTQCQLLVQVERILVAVLREIKHNLGDRCMALLRWVLVRHHHLFSYALRFAQFVKEFLIYLKAFIKHSRSIVLDAACA